MNFQVTEAEFYEQIGRLYVLNQKLEQSNAVLTAALQETEARSERQPPLDAPASSPSGEPPE